MIKRVFNLVFVLLLIPSLTFAQTSEFNINLVFTDDTTPPSTPTLLDVVPAAATQIDIDWSASIDDYAVGGYVLLRDSIAVATTTLTSFMDTGLTPETLYTYSVYAFDTAGNMSTTSNSLSTTTPALPVVIAPTSTPPGPITSTQTLQLRQLDIVPTLNSSAFFWETNIPARFVLKWGRNDSFDDGYILNDVYRSSNQTLITDLEPGTTYLYQLIGYSPSGVALNLKSGEFKTTVGEKTNTPNVKNLVASVSASDVFLSWQTPLPGESLTFKVVRSYLGYPTDPYDGAVVYEGPNNTFDDTNALSIHEVLFYTVFVISNDGTISSGAVVKAYKAAPITPIDNSNQGGNTNLDGETVPTQPPLPEPEAEIEILDFGFSVENIKIRQGEKLYDFKSESIYLLKNDPFVISIPYEALPEHLKSIVVTILDPLNYQRSYSFLLRINKDRTAYESTIAPLNVEGITRLQIEIFDYERQIIGRYSKQLDFITDSNSIGEVIFPDKIVKVFKPFLGTTSLLLFLLSMIMIYLYIRSRRGEDNV